MNGNFKVKSLAKALNILECFNLQERELGITEISKRLGLYKSNVYNIVSTLEQKGYLEKNEQNNRYHLGFKILELSYIINSNLGIHKVVKPIMQALANQVKETVYFVEPKDGKIIYLDGAYPVSAYAVRAMLGENAEMYCTSLGKAILAFLPPGEAARALGQQSMKPYTANTITDMEKLTIELDRIRQQGYSVDNMEHEHGIRCVGVPVFDHEGKLRGAISISGPSPRLDNNVIKDYARRLTIVAQQISILL